MNMMRWFCALAALAAIAYAVYAAYNIQDLAAAVAIGTSALFFIFFVMSHRAYDEIELLKSEYYQRQVDRLLQMDRCAAALALLVLPERTRRIMLRSLQDHGFDTSFAVTSRQSRKLVQCVSAMGRLDVAHFLCTLSDAERLPLLYRLPEVMGYRGAVPEGLIDSLAKILRHARNMDRVFAEVYNVDSVNEALQTHFPVSWEMFEEFKAKKLRQDRDANTPLRHCKFKA
jgi:hypothetical protein